MNAQNTMRIFIRDCNVDLRIGIDPSEKINPQRVIVNVELEANITHRYTDLADEDITKVLNYAPIRDFICKEVPQWGHIGLVETLAEHILEFCFKDPRVLKARVRVEKPHIFPETEAVGIELCRAR